MILKVGINNKEKLFLLYLLISVFVSITNVVFATNATAAALVVATELSLLAATLIKKQLAWFLSLYIIFTANCFEFSSFVGEDLFYNIKNFRFLGINLAIWALIPAFLYSIWNIHGLGRVKSLQPLFYFFSKNLLLLNFMAAFVGIILITVNDNGVQSFDNIFSLYLGEAYKMLFLPLLLCFVFLYVVIYTPKKIFYVGLALEAVLVGCMTQVLFAVSLGYYGLYGGVQTLLISNIHFFLPFSFLLVLDSENIVFPKLCFILGIISTVFVLTYNANGKHFLMLFLIIFIFSFYRNRNAYINVLKYLLLFIVLLFATDLLLFFAGDSVLYASKLNQALALLNIFDNDYLSALPSSPKIRIGEIVNILLEFYEKPWLFLTGKGYMGTIRDYAKWFTYTPGAFSYDQWAHGLFYNLHEIATQLLMYGFLGIVFASKLVVAVYKNARSNVWLWFGGYWFLVLYGYSFTLSVFGVATFYYGLIKEYRHKELL